jgi:hypothetical protein
LDGFGVVYTREKKLVRVECDLNGFGSIAILNVEGKRQQAMIVLTASRDK